MPPALIQQQKAVPIHDGDPDFIPATEAISETPPTIVTNTPFDHVTGIGCPVGALILVSGSPGAGKSHQCRELVLAWTPTFARSNALYCSYEERLEIVRGKLDSHDKQISSTLLLTEAPFCTDKILPGTEILRLVIVDSMQTATVGEMVTFAPGFKILPDGGVAFIERTDLGHPGSRRRCLALAIEALRLVRSDPNTTCVIVAHETKEKDVAGPQIIEHMVDVVMHFELNIEQMKRTLSITKNRFGPVGRFQI
jgi:DNA repair protein RadA/Sms